ncbi:CRP-like cAMP-binding protein [Paenibacillus turicensis]|uniref:CRP-like cAMP-binding protein n=1 Tax=Paenibacillus turicensis TaxID=160487 RepID=A0ABS4FTH6_9BACL|nr:cyclic nucleotide-binding domain-containing protein [Paenibacillus turicensis]MBP1905744.1 CRP-like cAMP-binding protein [Paenibacillus turicensis]
MKEVHDQEQLNGYLEQFQLEEVFHAPLRSHITLYKLSSGDVICYQGQQLEHLYVLVQGRIKIYSNSQEGQSLIVSFKSPLEIVGEIEYIRQIEIINTVEAVTEVYLIGIPYAWLRKLGNEHPPFLRFLLDIITRKFYIKSDFLSFNLMHPVEIRLASYLLSHVSEEAAMNGSFGHEVIGLADTANLIGTSYRHLNRIVGKFCEKGLVSRGARGTIYIRDLEGLQAMVDGKTTP